MKYLVALDMDISRCVSNSELAPDGVAVAAIPETRLEASTTTPW
jgi:hypothetical protein